MINTNSCGVGSTNRVVYDIKSGVYGFADL